MQKFANVRRILFGPLCEKNLFSMFANKKGVSKQKCADHPVQMSSLIIACVICLLESIISKLDTNKFSVLVYRGSYMSFHALLNLLLNDLRKRDKMRGLLSILSLFR